MGLAREVGGFDFRKAPIPDLHCRSASNFAGGASEEPNGPMRSPKTCAPPCLRLRDRHGAVAKIRRIVTCRRCTHAWVMLSDPRDLRSSSNGQADWIST